MLATISLSVASNQVASNSYPSLALSLNAYGKPKDLRVLYSASAGVQAKNASDAYGRLVKGMASVRKVIIIIAFLMSLLVHTEHIIGTAL
jgi:hypothetical protein